VLENLFARRWKLGILWFCNTSVLEKLVAKLSLNHLYSPNISKYQANEINRIFGLTTVNWMFLDDGILKCLLLKEVLNERKLFSWNL
jgi:hypothetical protein